MENENKFPRTRVFVLAALLLILLTFLLQYVIWHNSAPLASILLNTAQTSGVLTAGCLALGSMAIAPNVYRSVESRRPEKLKSQRYYTLIAFCALYVLCLVIMVIAAYA